MDCGYSVEPPRFRNIGDVKGIDWASIGKGYDSVMASVRIFVCDKGKRRESFGFKGNGRAT